MTLSNTVWSVSASAMAFGRHQTLFVHVESGHLPAFALERGAAVEHGLVLGADGDDVLAVGLARFGDPADRQVVALGRARGEDQLVRPGPNQARDLGPRKLYGIPGDRAVGVRPTRGIAEPVDEVREHPREDPLVDGGRRVVVHVNRRVVHWSAQA